MECLYFSKPTTRSMHLVKGKINWFTLELQQSLNCIFNILQRFALLLQTPSTPLAATIQRWLEVQI